MCLGIFVAIMNRIYNYFRFGKIINYQEWKVLYFYSAQCFFFILVQITIMLWIFGNLLITQCEFFQKSFTQSG